jgi:hypothetical protein
MGQGAIGGGRGQIIIGIHGKLVREGSTDIDLLVHCHHDNGSPSPYVVITNFGQPQIIGGAVTSLEQAFDAEVAKHPGYTVQQRCYLVTLFAPSRVSASPEDHS